MIDKKLIAYFEKQDSSFISDAFVKYVDHELEMLRYMMLENHGISGIDSPEFNLSDCDLFDWEDFFYRNGWAGMDADRFKAFIIKMKRLKRCL